MIGKELKVIENGLDFGVKSRMINVFGCFKYKPNNGLYVVYADVDSAYNLIYYGSAHTRGTSILSMACSKEDEEIIKEFVFKVTNGENLDNFSMISLEQMQGLEIIASNHFEIKTDVFTSLVNATIPKPVASDDNKPENNGKKKKKSSKTLLLFLFVIIIALGGAYLFLASSDTEESTKYIVCTITYQHDTLNATTDEEITYSFNHQDVLETIDTTITYQFNSQSDYQDFVNKGTIYKYMPDSDTEGGYVNDDEEFIFKVITKERIDETTYTDSTDYEDILVIAKDKGYSCVEEVS